TPSKYRHRRSARWQTRSLRATDAKICKHDACVEDLMDFNLPEEIQILRETVRRFVDKELIPLEREYRHDSEGPMPEHLLAPLQEKTKSMGLWMLDVPAEYGRAGLGLLARCIIHEQLTRRASLPFRSLELFGPEVRPVLFHCNEEQKKRFLEPVLRGELRFCFA